MSRSWWAGALVGSAALTVALLPTAEATPATARPAIAATSARVPTAPVVGVAGRPATGGKVRVHFSVPTRKPVFFLTIDDGWSKQQGAADYVRSRKLPLTVFLTNAAVGGRWSYFRAMAAYDSVQNHTMTHRALTSISSSSRRYEICEAQKRYAQRFGQRPWILRPPYGVGYMPRTSATSALEATASSCGITDVALWNVTVSQGGRLDFAGRPYSRGDIVLLHFNGDIEANLRKVVRLYAQRGLRPAPLSQYLTR